MSSLWIHKVRIMGGGTVYEEQYRVIKDIDPSPSSESVYAVPTVRGRDVKKRTLPCGSVPK